MDPEDARAFCEAYRAAWHSVIAEGADVDVLTPFFHGGCTLIDPAGGLTRLDGAAAIRAFNVTRRKAFLDGGAAAAVVDACTAEPLGDHLALATVDWRLTRPDGSAERAWRHRYVVRQDPDGRRAILLSAFAPGSGA